MKYHLSKVLDATPENWRLMLSAMSRKPHASVELAYAAMMVAAATAQILRNHRSELVAFLDSFWNPEWNTLYGRPDFESSMPFGFNVIRHRWSLTISVKYHDNTGTGSPKEGVTIDISSKDPEQVREFAHEAARDLGQSSWCGSLHFGDNYSIAPQTAFHTSVDHAVDALIALAAEEAASGVAEAKEAAAATT